MKLKIIFLITITFVLASCRKTYTYIEIVEEKGISGGSMQIKEKDPTMISAENDSLAYLEAYEDFCISLKVHKDMQESLGNSYSMPIRFKLLNDKKEDIAISISMNDKVKREEEIKSKIFALSNNIKESLENAKQQNAENFKTTTSIDSIKVKSLQRYFRTRWRRVFQIAEPLVHVKLVQSLQT